MFVARTIYLQKKYFFCSSHMFEMTKSNAGKKVKVINFMKGGKIQNSVWWQFYGGHLVLFEIISDDRSSDKIPWHTKYLSPISFN